MPPPSSETFVVSPGIAKECLRFSFVLDLQVLQRPGRAGQSLRAPNERGYPEKSQRLRQRRWLQVGPPKPEGAIWHSK